jgi:23S rRNA (pseudouridine1915-N3)-methyltransferase
MHWAIFAIGKPKLAFARAGIEEYEGRLRPFTPFRVEYLKASNQEAESAALLERSEGWFRIAMDERGDQIGSRALADKITRWEHDRIKGVALLVGGADGHTAKLRTEADWLWSLSKLTLQHELALTVALEQIYRAYTIKGGLPYHRE